jgi:hypothetical protein
VTFREERQTLAAVLAGFANPTVVRTFGGHILVLGGMVYLSGCTSHGRVARTATSRASRVIDIVTITTVLVVYDDHQ